MLFPRFTLPVHISAASFGISRVPVEPFARLPCSKTPAELPRQAFPAFQCCPLLP
jgi:hypothetical protein